MLPRSLLRSFAALALAGVGCVVYGVTIERRWYRLVRHRLAILPAGGEGPDTFSVLHLSDLHFVRERQAQGTIPRRAAPHADVTVVTGDFLGEPEAVERVVEAVRPVRGRLASWFVLGIQRLLLADAHSTTWRTSANEGGGAAPNPAAHPTWSPSSTDDGWQDLTNVRREIELDGLPIELLGLDDAHLRWHDLTIAPRSAPERFGLAVMHSPDSAPEAAALGYDLIVAGHTHGGQVCVPFGGALVTNCSMPRRLAAGLFRMGGAVLHTSRGLGTSKFAPFRFACRPEATLLELRRVATLEAPRDVAQLGSAQRSGR